MQVTQKNRKNTKKKDKYMTISLFIDFGKVANVQYENDGGGVKWPVLLLFYAS